VVSFTSRPLYPIYPLDRRLGGPQSRSERGGEEKNSEPPPIIENKHPIFVKAVPPFLRNQELPDRLTNKQTD